MPTIEYPNIQALSISQAIELPSEDMLANFQIRYRNHALLVSSAMSKVFRTRIGKDPNVPASRISNHDLDKFDDDQILGHIWLAEQARCLEVEEEFTKPSGFDTFTQNSLNLHRQAQAHHPEAHDGIQSMPVHDRVEFICNECSHSWENGGDVKDWFVANVGPDLAYDFTQEQTDEAEEWVDFLVKYVFA